MYRYTYGFDPYGRAKRRVRRAKRAAKRKAPPVIAKPGTRPLSLMHPQHPVRLYGWGDERTARRNRKVWV